jgi:hypothetical protein
MIRNQPEEQLPNFGFRSSLFTQTIPQELQKEMGSPGIEVKEGLWMRLHSVLIV